MIEHTPSNLSPIHVINAWLSVDKNGNEGIAAAGIMDEKGGVTMFPMVWSSEQGCHIPDEVIEGARKAAEKHGLRLVKATFARVG